jgi:hypothetical protein
VFGAQAPWPEPRAEANIDAGVIAASFAELL